MANEKRKLFSKENLERLNNFADSQWGNTISKWFDIASSLINDRPEYSGTKGQITQGMDAAYDTIQQGISSIPGFGKAAGLAMSGLKFFNKGLGRIGGGTDGMTTTDAILGSNFLGWTPLGLINGFGGQRANSYTRNIELDAATNGGFQGFLKTQDITSIGAGKKYGLFSSGARNKQNELTEFTTNMKHSVSNVVDTNTINNLAAQGSTPFIAMSQTMDMNGGPQQMRAARQGLKMPKYKREKGIKNLTPKHFGPEGLVQLYDKDGNPTRGLTRYQELGYEPVVKYDGTAGFIGYKSNPALPYLLTAKRAKNGQKLRRIAKKCQLGNKLKRTFQTVDVHTGKIVELPKDLDKDQIEGRKPIVLPDGMVVFMNGDGTVDSNKWQTLGEREHLTPKGQKGMKLRSIQELIDYAKQKNPEFIQRLSKDPIPVQFIDIYKPIQPMMGTHYMTSVGNRVFASIMPIDGKMTYFELPQAKDYAYSTGNYLEFNSPEEAELFAKEYKQGWPEFFKKYDAIPYTQFYKQGGQMNVIPEGALHARLNHYDEVDEKLAEQVTDKGIAVVSVEEGGEIVQHAEIEHSEIIFRKEVTDKLEKLRKEDTDESAIEAGKLLVDEIFNNTDDRVGLIDSVE